MSPKDFWQKMSELSSQDAMVDHMHRMIGLNMLELLRTTEIDDFVRIRENSKVWFNMLEMIGAADGELEAINASKSTTEWTA